MKTTKYVFTKAEIGCWIDGAFGMDHAADKLMAMLANCPQTESIETLIDELDPTSVVRYEVLDDATDALWAFTEPGLVWIWEAGDLILTTKDETD